MILPIAPHRERILEALREAPCLILTAPTGSGKSTQVPRFLLEAAPASAAGRILVLEPRRLAARGLAARVAAETGTALGGPVGYQVRFDSRCGPGTRVVFQTYGVFIQALADNPWLDGTSAVLLDEFHERTLECDLALAWLKAAKPRRPDLAIGVLSATLDAAALAAYWPGARHLDVPGRLFPVDLRWSPPRAGEGPAEAALRALRGLAAERLDGSVLVFMPGAREIRRTCAALAPFCRAGGLALQELHGSMTLEEQARVLDPAGGGRRVIVATNVAETSLTIPGVTAVVDSGLHRIAAYAPGRGVNTLYLRRVALRNADQRAGRAGRTAPGRCVRLWARSEEASMAGEVQPEITRLELSALRLRAAALPAGVDWPTPPSPQAWAQAEDCLKSLGAMDERGRATPRGLEFASYPLPPRLAAVLEEARAVGPKAFAQACAMAAIHESAAERRQGVTVDLGAAGRELLEGGGDFPWETGEICRQLRRLGTGRTAPAKTGVPAGQGRTREGGQARAPGREEDASAAWLRVFADRLAARAGAGLSYALADGRQALLPIPANRTPPPLVLALEIHETAGAGQNRQVSIPLHLPCEAADVERLFPGACAWTAVAEFDKKASGVVQEERLMFRGLVIASRAVQGARQDRRAAAGLLAERLASGELRHPGMGPEVEQLLARIAVARRLYPQMGFPAMGREDWLKVYEDACGGACALKDLAPAGLAKSIGRLLGAKLLGFLDARLPGRWKLKSGRSGRLSYFESRPPELSARLGDFIGMSGTLALCDGRLPVVFDILAPNNRTVQKTSDLSSFWRNAYPEIKSRLKRRYPKHPWP